MKKYLLQIIERNLENPLQAGPINSIEGDSMIELCSKFSLLIAEILIRIHKVEWKDDDIPF